MSFYEFKMCFSAIQNPFFFVIALRFYSCVTFPHTFILMLILVDDKDAE